MKRLLVALALFSLPQASFASEKWPAISIIDEQIELLDRTLDGPYGNFFDTSYLDRLARYDPAGDYLRYSLVTHRTAGMVVLDDEGLPQIVYRGETYYNPVTLSQYSLAAHGRFANGDIGEKDTFKAGVEKLLTLQDESGGFPYPIELHHKTPPLQPGWLSAMAQGQAISALTRAFRVFDDPRYLDASILAFRNMQIDIRDGGTRYSLADLDPSLSSYVFFPEYPYAKIDYTLNGYMFTLLGLYDLSLIDSEVQSLAERDFHAGIETLEKIIHYYDIDGYSTYDLGHIDLPLNCHPAAIRASAVSVTP